MHEKKSSENKKSDAREPLPEFAKKIANMVILNLWVMYLRNDLISSKELLDKVSELDPKLLELVLTEVNNIAEARLSEFEEKN